MYNIKRLAYEITPPPDAAMIPGSTDPVSQNHRAVEDVSPTPVGLDEVRIDEIVRRVLAELKK